LEPDAVEEACEAKFLDPKFNYDLEECRRVSAITQAFS
jgi:hypothetical protein